MPSHVNPDQGVLLILPTMGSPQLVLPNIQRVLSSLGELPVHILVVCNPTHEGLQAVPLVQAQVEAMVSNTEAMRPGSVSMECSNSPAPPGGPER